MKSLNKGTLHILKLIEEMHNILKNFKYKESSNYPINILYWTEDLESSIILLKYDFIKRHELVKNL